MEWESFQEEAHRIYEEIPSEYREGIDALAVRREALPHPTHRDIYTLGMCYTEAYPSGFEGPETTRSVVALYYGSFQRLAELDPDFDWDGELWETLTHELRHHLEWLANEDQLEGVDYAMEEGFKRAEGELFDPWYYQSGDPMAEGVYRVEYDYYLEQEWREEDFAAAREITFRWHGGEWAIPRPDTLGDVHFVWVHGVDVGPGTLQLVLLREKSLRKAVSRFFQGRGPELLESEAEARHPRQAIG
ncbi:MAG: hypothetical protein WEA09_04725 [Gemmatimonadota bacterium]